MRVVIADDNMLIREGLAAILQDAGFEVVGKSGNPDDLLLRLLEPRPRVRLLADLLLE